MEKIAWMETLPHKVKFWSDTQPEKLAVCVGEKGTTYAELEEKVNCCCANLSDMGLSQGDYVVLSAVMKVEYIAAFLAVKKLRMVAVPVNRTASEAEVIDIVERTGAKVFLTDNPKYQKIHGVRSLTNSCAQNDCSDDESEAKTEFVSGDEITEILFTSGTTGRSKGAMLSQKGICASIYNTVTGMDMQRDDVVLLPLPLNHSFGLRVLRAALFCGETIVLQNGFSFAREVQQNIERWHCNCMAAVISGFEMLQQQMGETYISTFEKLKYIEFSAGPVSVMKRKQLIRDLPNVKLYNTWGSTETGGGLFLEFSATQDKIESAGKAINDIQLAVVDTDGKALRVGESGRLALSGSALMAGYFGEPGLTEETLHGEWLWTNDLAKLDEDGYVYLSGRVDDIISVGGEKVSPADVERIVSAQPGVKECACCGVDDPKGILGQVPVVFIVAAENGYDEKQIEGEVRKKGNGFMVPSAFVNLPELPRNYMGKVDRSKLKEIWNTKNKPAQKEMDGNDFAASVLSLMVNRRSIRNFTEKQVEKNKIEDILLAGRYAPSGHNMQTWKFTVINEGAEIKRLKEVTKTVAERRTSSFYGFHNPSTLIIVSNNRKNILAKQDSSAAIENMLLMAHAHGLGACWLNSWISISDEPEIRALFDRYSIPKEHIVYGIVALGYAANPVKTPAKKENVVFYFDSETPYKY